MLLASPEDPETDDDAETNKIELVLRMPKKSWQLPSRICQNAADTNRAHSFNYAPHEGDL